MNNVNKALRKEGVFYRSLSEGRYGRSKADGMPRSSGIKEFKTVMFE